MSDADEMILAGSRPGPTHSNPIDALHSRTSFVLIIDSVIFAWLIYVLTGNPMIAAVPGVFSLFVWMGYRQKAAWAYWFAPMIIGGITLIFTFILLVNLYYLFSGSSSSLLMILILIWAIYSSTRFIRIHFHPVYKMGYSGYSVQDENTHLARGEMLASCPTCLAVLAVNPMLLSHEDSCPHCDSPLVLRNEEE